MQVTQDNKLRLFGILVVVCTLLGVVVWQQSALWPKQPISTNNTIVTATQHLYKLQVHLFFDNSKSNGGDGIQQSGEPPLANVTVALDGENVTKTNSTGWAVIDRKLRYKRSEDIPHLLLRKIFRIAGLLELVDQEFQAIRDDSTRLLEIYPSTPINAGTLTSYFQTAPTVSQIWLEAYKVGFVEDANDTANANELISACDKTGIRSIGDLEHFLSSLADIRANFFKEITRVGGQKWKAGAMMLTLMLLYGRFPRKFTMVYLTRRGWNSQTIAIIRSCASCSRLVRIR